MKLRSSILLTLLLFAVIPAALFVVLSLPLMMDRIQTFYQQAHLQALRADFRDLDEHLAARRELIRILTKLPEPGVALGNRAMDTHFLQSEREHYSSWINTLSREQFDVVGIAFLAAEATTAYWLIRQEDGRLAPVKDGQLPQQLPDSNFLRDAFAVDSNTVLISPVYTDNTTKRPQPHLYLVSPIYGNSNSAEAIVIVKLDIGGLASAYRDTLWVDASGRYVGNVNAERISAFDDYAGLATLFNENRMVLWQDPDAGQIIWVPLFRAANGEPLWVGRVVGQSPIASLWRNLLLRGLLVALPVLLGIWLVARFVSRRVGEVGNHLSAGVKHILTEDKVVAFNWQQPQELKEVAEDLNQLSMTHARNQRNLRSHTQELEQSNKFKSEFLANVSHELKTPLNAILVLSKLLRDGNQLPPEQREQAHTIYNAGRDLNVLIENILELSMLERMDQELHLQQLDIVQLLHDVIALLRPLYAEKGLSLRLQKPASALPLVTTDADKLKQILRNLLANALKFTHEGGATLSLELDVTQTLPLRIRVSDTGMGIAPDQQQRIFDAFTQADGSIRRHFGGTGLGLNINRRLIELLGGQIQVVSTLGAGATFILHLPLQSQAQLTDISEPMSPVVARAVATSSDHNPDFSGRRILIIDNDLDHLLQLSRILSKWRVEIVVASEPDEIREALQDNPDCLLTLVNTKLCGASNCDSIGVIRQSGMKCTLVALRDSTLAMDSSLSALFDADLQVPFDADKLQSLIQQQLDA